MKKLLIVESPAKIKTISKFLGKDYKIMATMGHVKDLPKNRLGVKINGSIDIEYVTIENKDKVIKEIQNAAKSSEEIYIAPDPDREGEIIAFHIANAIKEVTKNKNSIHRISFNEITKPAIIEAINSPEHINMRKVSAQQARRILDRWVGYQVSPILWKKIAKGLSAGRVQSVTLKFICDREIEIEKFKIEEYWTIDGIFNKSKEPFIAQLSHINKKPAKIDNKKQVDKITQELKESKFIIDSITDKKRNKNPYPPFMTSSLQQDAYNKLGFPVKATMKVAQSLYEGIPLEDPKNPVALITYMRTDSLRVSDTAIKQSRDFISKNFDKNYLPKGSNVYSKKTKAQDAHEAIRPVNIEITPESVKQYLSTQAFKLYELIWKRFVASQMSPAKYAQRQVIIKSEKFTFRITGSTLIFDGFLKIYKADETEDDKKASSTKIPKDLAAKDNVKLEKIDPKQHFTQPPPRYTEASLVKALEKEGIGRPSTYATILNTIQTRSYTKLDDKKRFVPTELGRAVISLLVENLPKIMNAKFTANMEDDLDKIAHGELDRDKLLRSFYKDFEADLKKFAGQKHDELPTVTDIKCPECKKGFLKIRSGKTGEFLGCTNYPECMFTSNFKRTEKGKIELTETKKPALLKEKCPECGQPLRQLNGKYGPFIACSGFPKCKYIQREKANFKCPECKSNIYKGQWRGGIFWGCENYPKCKYVIFGDIEQKPCPKCKSPFLVKKQTSDGKTVLYCYNKSCDYKKNI